ncbi:MAG: hypothetical protein Q3971_03525 [Moraxella sp.]|nr:hypothetical protein [Moraxella sp.]
MLLQLKQKNLRLYLFAWHVLISVIIAVGVGVLVFWLWFPYPYQYLTRGLNLFLLIIVVDVVCGPLITLLLANPKKSKKELTLDLTLVAIIQLMALCYGIYTLEKARPVLMSFERDRMTLVLKSEIDWSDIDNAPKELKVIPLVGVNKIGIRRAENEQEFFESVNLSMEGVEPSVRPSWWRSYNEVIPEIQEKMKSINNIDRSKLSDKQIQELDKVIAKSGVSSDELYYLPFTSTLNKGWIVLMDKETDLVGYVNIDGFN